MFANAWTPFAYSSASESASESQKWSSASFSRIGSFTMPPSGAQISTYLHCSGTVADRSRGVSSCVNAAASGPRISSWRSTATSHSVT